MATERKKLQRLHTRWRGLAVSTLGVLLLAGCHKILGLTGADQTQGALTRADAGSRSDSAESDADHDPDHAGADVATSPGSLSPACTEYCESVGSACTGAALQYLTDGDCAIFCTALEEHDRLAPVCRTSRLQDFQEDACSAAGPTGSSLDGRSCEDDPCELYCGLMRGVCTDTRLGEPDSNAPTAANDGACLRICNALTPSPDYDVTPPPTGSNLNCRIHHINLALRSPVGSNLRLDHCLHAAGQAGLFEARFTPCPD